MGNKRLAKRHRRRSNTNKHLHATGQSRFEQLEDRVLLTVDFVAAPLDSVATVNRPDQALGLSNPFTQPTIALDPNDPGIIAIANETQLIVSSNATTTFDGSGDFQSILGDSATASGSSDLVYTQDGELKWASLRTNEAGTQSIGVTLSTGAQFGITAIPFAVGAEQVRPAIVVDTNLASASAFSGNIYVSFADESTNQVLLSRSTDNGASWETPVQVSQDSDTTDGSFAPVTPGSVTVGPNGDVYVAYQYQSGTTEVSGADDQSNADGETGQVFVRRSIDGGLSFQPSTNAFLPGEADISLNVRTSVDAVEFVRFSLDGARQPTVLADPVREGHIYVVANDDPDNSHGSGDEGDVVVARSTDFGQTWDRRTIPTPAGTLQVMPQAEIDEFGNLVLAWYDSQRGLLMGLDQFRFDVYATYSTDGGSTFATPFRINDDSNPIDPDTPDSGIAFPGADRDNDGRPEDDGDETYSMGDSFDLEAFGGTAYVVWNGNERVLGLPSAHQVFLDLFPIFGTLHVAGLDTDDTFLVRTMADNDEFIEVFVNGQRQYVGLRESLIGGIQIDGLAGNDTLIVDFQAGGDPVPTGGIFFQGNIPEGGNDVGDTLDLLTGDLPIDYQADSTDPDAGLFVVGDSAAISFDSVERTQVETSDYIRPDLHETNSTFRTATVLGSDPAVTLRELTIHDLGDGNSDPDFFRVTASETGVLVFNASFEHADGDLNMVVLDAAGNTIASVASASDNEQIVIPAVAQETYWVQVFGADGAINHYSLDVTNIAATVPQSIHLAEQSDTGMASNDNITADTSPLILVQADLGLLRTQGINTLTSNEANAGATPGAAIIVMATSEESGQVVSGFAELLPGSDDLFALRLPSLPSGSYIVAAAVQVFDGQLSSGGVASPASGRTALSNSIGIDVDAISPSISSPQMLGSSDTGMDRSDGVTSIMQPAFLGTAEPNSQVRILANGLIVGQTVTGTDSRWEITIEPLSEGLYFLTTQAEDVAGNFSENNNVRVIEIDKTPPNTPFLDLTAGSDTGSSDSDNMTGDNTLTFTMTTTDLNSEDHLNEFNFKYRLYVRPEGGTETLIYNSVTDRTIPFINSEGGFTNLEMLTATLDELPDGNHNFKLEVEDRAGNISEDFLLDVKIDTALPTAITIDLLNDSDTGMDDTDNVTRFSRPTVSGVGDAGAIVSVFAGDRLIGLGTVGSDASDGVPGNGQGAWQITTGSLDDGIYELTAVIENNVGTVASELLTIEVDSLQPNTPALDLVPASDSGFSQSDEITNETNLTFHFATEDPNQASHRFAMNYKYRLYLRLESGAEELVYDSVGDSEILDSATDGVFTSLENFTRQIGRTLPQGVHNFKLEVEDRAGNISVDTLLDVQVDTVLEGDLNLDLLVASDSGMDSLDRVTNISQPTFEGLSEVGSVVSLFANNKLVGSVTVGRDALSPEDTLGEWSITSAPLVDGVYDVFARVEDPAGNAVQTVTQTLEVDTEAPNTPFLDLDITSDDGVSGTDNFTSRNSLLFNMSTTDPGQADHEIQANYKFRLYMRSSDQVEQLVYDSSQDAALELVGGFTSLEALKTTVSDLPDGDYNFKLEVEDRAGNISHDALLDVVIGEVDEPVVGVDIQVPTTIQLVASSDAGMSPTDGVTSINAPVFSGLGEIDSTVQLFANGEVVGTGVVGGDLTDGVADDGIGLWQVTSGVLSDGVYQVLAVVEDGSGNLTASEEVTIEIDTLQPNTPLLDLVSSSDTGHSSTDNITLTRNPTFNMVTVDPNEEIHRDRFNFKYRLYVRLDSGVEDLVYDSVGDAETPNSATDGVFTSLKNLRRTIARGIPDGTHNFKLEVEDRAGNISEDFLLNVTVDTELETGPFGVIADLANIADTGMDNRDDITKINRPVITGVGEVGAEVSLYAGGDLVGTTTVGSDDTDFVVDDGLGAWEITSQPLVDGQHELIVHMEDWAGNFERSAEPLSIDIDTTPPNTPYLDLVGGVHVDQSFEKTNSASLTFTMTTEDPAIENRANPFNYKYRIFLRPEGGSESLLYSSANDLGIDQDRLSGGFTDLTMLQTTVDDLPEGVHNFKLEVEDRAGNISHDHLLTVEINRSVDALTIDLLPSSDTGMSDSDDVTNKDQPAFNGVGTIGSMVRLLANDVIVGTATVGGDASNGILDDGLGVWEITSKPLDDGIYITFAEIEDGVGNVAQTGQITFEIDTLQPNTPLLDLLPSEDSGLSESDNVTQTGSPTFNLTTIDPNQASHVSEFNYKYRLFVRSDSGGEELVYDSSSDETIPGVSFEGGFTNLENLTRAISADLPDGVHNFKLEVEDRAGNISEDFLLNVEVDSSLDQPIGGVTIDMTSASDSGMSDRDDVTRINQPTLTGQAEVGATVSIFANGQLVGVGTVGSDETDFIPGNGLGVWEVTTETLDDGVYSLLAHIEDLAGNFERTAEATIEIDTTQPNTPYLDLLNDTGHSDHDNITEDELLSFNLTSEDADPAGGRLNDFNLKFRIFLRPEGGEETLVFDSVTDANVAQELLSGGFTSVNQLEAVLGPFPDGKHNFKLEVEDRAGNISEDFLLNVQIDTDLTGTPDVDMIASSDSGMDSTDNVTGIDQPAFVGVSEVGSTVRLRANGVLIGIGEVQSDASDGVPGDGLGQWEITSKPLDDGIYEIMVDVEDWAGNIETSEALTVEIDTLQPNTPVLDLLPTSDSGLSDSDNVTNQIMPFFNMATIDPNQDSHLIESNYKYRLFVRHDSGVELLLYSSVDDDSFTPSSKPGGFTSLENLRRELDLGVPDGVHNFKLEVEDRAGNISEDFLLNVTIDTVLEAPDETINIDMLSQSDSGMSNSDNVTSKDQPAFTGVAEVGAAVTIFADGQIVGTGVVGSDETDGAPGDGFGAWEVTVEPLNDGVHNVTAHVEDLAGNFLQSEALQIEVDTRAPNTPFLDLVSASDTGIGGRDEVTSDNTLTFNMTTTDGAAVGDHLFEENFKFRLYVRPEGAAEALIYDSVTDGGFQPGDVVDGLISESFLQRTLGELPDGTHNFKLEVEDRAGNISDDFLLNVTIDTTLVAPTIDLIPSSDSGMSNIDNVTKIDQPTFVGTGDVGDRVSLFANGVLVGTGFVGSDETDFVPGDGRGAWLIRTQPLDDGIYDVLAHIEDQAGNFQRTEVVQIEVDTLEPNTPRLDLVTSSDTGHSVHDNITGDTTPTFTITTEDPNQATHLSQFNYKYRLYLRLEGQNEGLLYDSVTDDEIDPAFISESFTNLQFLERTFGPLPNGIHNVKLEVEDRAGNISHDVTLDFEIDDTLPDVGQIDMLEASDSGMSNSDNVTSINQPAFSGLGTPGTQVRLFANGQFVGTAEVGSDESDGVTGNELGIWEITSEPLADDVYTINATFEDWAGNISTSPALTIEVDTIEPNTPFLDLLEVDDSGRHNDDNVTNAATLSFNATTEDSNLANHLEMFPAGQNLKYRLFVRPEAGNEFLLYDSSTDGTLPGSLDGLVALTQITTPGAALPEGLHNLKLEVEDRAGNISHDFLLDVLVDRTAPDGSADLSPDSDTGVWGIDSTFGDGITGIASPPSFTGVTEANSIVTLLVNDEFSGSTVAKPFDGDEAFIQAGWELTSSRLIPPGDVVFGVTFEDLAGNVTDADDLDLPTIVVDHLGPVIENITRLDANFTSVFDPKPAGGPDPLIDSIVVHFADGPDRPADVLYGAVLAELALEEGNYSVVGDANGNIPITAVNIIGGSPGPGIATTAVQLVFASPLPDDRFTLTVSDRISDAAGNPLDGESGAAAPFAGNAGLTPTDPIFPTGDGNHGGDYVGRFTIDSRPEVGVWSAGSVYVDTNGNSIWDPTNTDFSNRDISYAAGFTSDDVFAGNFAGVNGVADGYDKVAVYGRYGGWVDGTFRWLIDLDNDGVIDIDVEDHADVNGLPVAGNFDGDIINGDEVGLYTGDTWYFDTDGDYLVDSELQSELVGYPVVGDFDGDGFEDLATWADDTYMVDLAGGVQNGWDGIADATFRFGFIGVRERPIAADMDQDGFDDLGLWTPDRGGMTPRESGEWYWLVSGGNSLLDRIVPATDPFEGKENEIAFRPVPFGNDIFAQFGDEFAIPIVGNFDPPTQGAAQVVDHSGRFTNQSNPLDVNDDGTVSPQDVLMIVNFINANGSSSVDVLGIDEHYLDTNADDNVSPVDVLAIINALNESSTAAAGEPDDLDAIAADIAVASWASDDDGEDEDFEDLFV